MIGKLQSNKVKFAVPLFDYIHSLDNLKLAEKIANEQSKKTGKLKYLFKLILLMKVKKAGFIKTKQKPFIKFVIMIWD